ncbi:MAG: hypothetical protein HY071_05230 [Chloroflexi bacterium]|nr:hypothetical protein [Chloroflexota bacterium]
MTFRELPGGGLYASTVVLPDGREFPAARGEVPTSGTLTISYATTADTKVYPRGTYQYRLNAGGVARAISFAIE